MQQTRPAGGATEADIADGMEKAQDECLAHGISSVANSLTPGVAIRGWQRMRREARWRLRLGIIASARKGWSRI